MAIDDAVPTAATALTTMAQWEALFVGGMGGASGVVAGKGGELAPSINSGARTVSIATGSALVRGFYTNNPATTATAVPTASAGDRVDRLVLRLDRTAVTAPNWIKLVIIQGTPGSATPPAIQSTDNASWDLPVCRWTTKADGTLAGLVDERYLLGRQFSSFKSTARPAASPPGLGRESDTGRLLLADGSAWSDLLPDTGWVALKTDTTYWAEGAFSLQIRRINNDVRIRGSVVRHVNKLSISDSGSHVMTIPAGYRPTASHLYTAWVSGGIVCQVRIYTTGDMQITDHAIDGVAVNHSVYLDTAYLIG